MLGKTMEASPVWAGDKDGCGFVYDSSGRLVGLPGESFLQIGEAWDMNVRSPWRRLMPGILFMGFNGKADSRLYVTTSRIVLIREIDIWRQLGGEMTPLGMPNAIAAEAELRKLKLAGIRQFCVVRVASLGRVSSRKYVKHGSRLDLALISNEGVEYAISFWKTDGRDDEMLRLIESQFKSGLPVR